MNDSKGDSSLTRLRAGVIGAGAFGRHHMAKLAASDRAVLSGVFDPDLDRAKALAEAQGCDVFPSFDALLEASDAVTVASPADTHGALAHDALVAGRHVYVEKPLACAPETARALAAEAKARGVTLGVGHQERFVFAALGALDPDSRPRRIEARRFGPWTGRGADVSCILDLMIHDLDLVGAAFRGAHLVGASAETEIVRGPDADTAHAELVFEGGLRAHLAASRVADRRERVTVLEYDDGEVVIDFLSRQVRSTRPNFVAGRFDMDDPRLADPLGHGVEAFLAAARGEMGPRPVSGEDGARAVALAAAVENAAVAVRRIA